MLSNGVDMKSASLNIEKLPHCEIRDESKSLVARMNRSGRPVVVTHRGKQTAIAMGISKYESMVEEIETLRDIQTALQQIKQGKAIPHAVVAQKLKKRLDHAR